MVEDGGDGCGGGRRRWMGWRTEAGVARQQTTLLTQMCDKKFDELELPEGQRRDFITICVGSVLDSPDGDFINAVLKKYKINPQKVIDSYMCIFHDKSLCNFK